MQVTVDYDGVEKRQRISHQYMPQSMYAGIKNIDGQSGKIVGGAPTFHGEPGAWVLMVKFKRGVVSIGAPFVYVSDWTDTENCKVLTWTDNSIPQFDGTHSSGSSESASDSEVDDSGSHESDLVLDDRYGISGGSSSSPESSGDSSSSPPSNSAPPSNSTPPSNSSPESIDSNESYESDLVVNGGDGSLIMMHDANADDVDDEFDEFDEFEELDEFDSTKSCDFDADSISTSLSCVFSSPDELVSKPNVTSILPVVSCFACCACFACFACNFANSALFCTNEIYTLCIPRA